MRIAPPPELHGKPVKVVRYALLNPEQREAHRSHDIAGTPEEAPAALALVYWGESLFLFQLAEDGRVLDDDWFDSMEEARVSTLCEDADWEDV